MIQEIKNLIYTKFSANDKIGLFFSAFDKNGKLLISNGVISTDKTLDDLISLLYNGYILPNESKIGHIIIDLVNEVYSQTNITDFLNMDPKIYGVILSEAQGSKTGVMLPNIKGITTMKQVLAGIKSKYQLQGNVNIFTFTVTELTLDKN